MNIQIFGKSKCFDTKKAQRYFKERGISYQSIDLDKKGLSPGEYQSIKKAAGSMEALIDENTKEYSEQFMAYLARDEDREERLLNNPKMFKTPIVRNGKEATVGYAPDIWQTWE